MLAEIGSDTLADLAIPRRHDAALGTATRMHIGARIACGRHAVDRTHRLAIDQDDALVPSPHRGLVALQHERLGRAREMGVDQRTEILVVFLEAEDAGAAI